MGLVRVVGPWVGLVGWVGPGGWVGLGGVRVSGRVRVGLSGCGGSEWVAKSEGVGGGWVSGWVWWFFRFARRRRCGLGGSRIGHCHPMFLSWSTKGDLVWLGGWVGLGCRNLVRDSCTHDLGLHPSAP
jgi:hypothetical protein